MDGRYQEFSLHQDNIEEIVSADDINQIGEQVQDNERALFKLRDEQFLERCLFVLENHPIVNLLWIDDFHDVTKLDMTQFTDMVQSMEEGAISLANSIQSGTVTSKTYQPLTGSTILKVILMTEDLVPDGTSIIYMISTNDGVTWTPIIANQASLTTISSPGKKMRVRAKFQRSGAEVGYPVVYNWSVLYEDPVYTPYIPDTMPTSTPITVQFLSHLNL